MTIKPQQPPEYGKVIQRLRKSSNLSLGDLSEQSGVAKSIISQIERNENNPTVSTLWRLSLALDTSIDAVFKNDKKQNFVQHAKASDTPKLTSEDGKCWLSIIGWLDTIDWVQYYWFEAEPGGILESEPHQSGSVENLSIIAGELEVTVNDEIKIAKQNETLRYRGDSFHSIKNIGSETAKAVMVNILNPKMFNKL